ncbi:MAG: adenosylcobinamide-GDP ribazoletransferase [Acidimicrobiia bacterium]
MRAAVGFLTVLGGAERPDGRAPAWFGAVGALVGLAVGGVWWGADRLWAPALAATLAVGADALLTGMLHLDGLADTADGLLPPADRARRRAIMASPDVGAFGLVAVVLVLAARIGALAELPPSPLLVAGLWALVRAGMALAIVWLPYAGAGIARGFRPSGTASTVAAGVSAVVAGALIVIAAGALSGLAALGGAVAAFAAILGLGVRRLGGFSGDVLGAAGVTGETAGLLMAAAQW